MTLFVPSPRPRIFGQPPGADFTRALIAGLDARLAGQPPEAAARVEIWVNTQRARRALIADLAAGPARLLPRIRVVTELAADPLAPVALPPPVPLLRRKLELARLVARLGGDQPGIAAETAAFDLADSLAELLDELQGEGLGPAALAAVDPAEHAAHWQRSLAFLDILGDYLAAAGMIDGQGRMRAVAAAWAEAWAAAPPEHPIIVAGSTGSRTATRLFMAAVARLPQGALVLPGFDATLPEAVWQRLGDDDAGAADHPQHGFRRLAEAIGFDLADVAPWHPAPPPAPERNALVSLALRPAPVTDQWRSEGARLAGTLDRACAGLTWLEAPDPRAEARAIALELKRAADAGTRAALVTPHRLLARRVTAELDRWRVIPDDSAGRPLGLTPPGVLLRRLAALPGVPLTPADLLVLLKHPLVSSAPGARRGHLALTARLETRRLRGGPPFVDWAALRAWAPDAEAARWLDWLERALGPLVDPAPLPLAAHVARHLAAAETLAAGVDGVAAHELWQREAGQQARAMLAALEAEAGAYGAMRPAEYRALVRSLIAARDVPEEAVVTDGGIAIWGTLEARVQSADLVILGGLNEGVWPRAPRADPWLSRGMRRAIGLPSPERAVGLAAHDFQQAMGAARVIVTRASRDAEAPTVASRWLLRLENLLGGLGAEGTAALAAARERGKRLLAEAAALDRPTTPVAPARRPAPRPPLDARPAELPVTEIERLVLDPYAVYARRVLKLRPLEPPGHAADARARGTALHTALDAFLRETAAGLPADAEASFRQAVADALAVAAPWPAIRAIWTAKFERSAPWFLAGEAERRARARPLVREATGRRPLTGLAQPFSVTAKADRIDGAADGSYAIYDYKAGQAFGSTPRQLYLQLHLEAAIAEAGGFDGLAPGPAAHLELLGIGAREAKPLDARPEAVAEVWARLGELIAWYQDPANGFVARLRPHRIKFPGDYDHLARRGEWADGDAPEDAP